MRQSGLISAILLLLAINGIVLAGVYFNRSGVPDATVALSERELPLAYNYRHKENSSLSLRLNWNRQGHEWSWLDKAKLIELGFDEDILDYVRKRENYYRPLPIKAYVVLEFNGETWQGFLQKQQTKIDELPIQVADGKILQEAADNQREQLEASMRLASRLFAIDAGLDPESLRGRYPDRQSYLILPAEFRAVTSWETQPKSSERLLTLTGRIDNIMTNYIYVPRKYHNILEQLPSQERIYPGDYYYNVNNKQKAHYKVQLNVGKRYEPWIEDIAAIE